MKCLIVDDEPLAVQLLESYVQRIDGLVLIKSCSNAIEAFTLMQHKSVDLLFLDIQMPQITGLDLVKTLKDKPLTVLTTAYREYASEAYDLDVVDYLVKPILFERFLKSIGKVYQFRHLQPTAPESTASTSHTTYEDAYIYLKEDREMIKVFLKDILYIESLRDYVRVKTLEQQVITYQKISYLEQKLPENKFIRIHRSFIVALDKITAFTPTSVKTAHIDIPIGRNYKTEVIKALHRNNILLHV
jgi:DNA-binding LytR/AlgR family response regulator